MTLKPVDIHGWLKTVNDNFDQMKGFVGAEPGLGVLRVARWVFDVEGVDSEGADNAAIGSHGTGIILPAFAIVVGGFMDVNLAFTSESANTGKIAITVQSAGDIQTAKKAEEAPWSTYGLKAIVPKANTPEGTGIKLTEDREVIAVVSVAEFLTGKVTGYLYYLEGEYSGGPPASGSGS